MNPKLILALDFASSQEALSLVNQLDSRKCALKVGSEMFSLFGPDFVRQLVKMGFKVFLDLKFHDIPNTVAKACQASAELGVWMVNVHASGGQLMMQAAREALESFGTNRPLLVAVTVLTSMSEKDLAPIGISDSLEVQVDRLAKLSAKAGLDGIVCSAYEVELVKKSCGPSFLTVTPGIRLSQTKNDDQTRIMTPSQALALGSDFLVVGRPITAAAKPANVVNEILATLDAM